MDINEANEQKKLKIMIPCSLCRRNCHLISNDGTLKNILNRKVLKKLDEANCRTGNIIFGARCNRHSDIYSWLTKIILTGEIFGRQVFAIWQVLGNFAKINPKKLRIFCICEIESLKNFSFWPFAKINPLIFFLKKSRILEFGVK